MTRRLAILVNSLEAARIAEAATAAHKDLDVEVTIQQEEPQPTMSPSRTPLLAMALAATAMDTMPEGLVTAYRNRITKSGSRKCDGEGCTKTISANKKYCLACLEFEEAH